MFVEIYKDVQLSGAYKDKDLVYKIGQFLLMSDDSEAKSHKFPRGLLKATTCKTIEKLHVYYILIYQIEGVEEIEDVLKLWE